MDPGEREKVPQHGCANRVIGVVALRVELDAEYRAIMPLYRLNR
jgi:hypothetical protein